MIYANAFICCYTVTCLLFILLHIIGAFVYIRGINVNQSVGIFISIVLRVTNVKKYS